MKTGEITFTLHWCSNIVLTPCRKYNLERMKVSFSLWIFGWIYTHLKQFVGIVPPEIVRARWFFLFLGERWGNFIWIFDDHDILLYIIHMLNLRDWFQNWLPQFFSTNVNLKSLSPEPQNGFINLVLHQSFVKWF